MTQREWNLLLYLDGKGVEHCTDEELRLLNALAKQLTDDDEIAPERDEEATPR